MASFEIELMWCLRSCFHFPERFESAAPLVQQPAGPDEAPTAVGAQPRGYDEMRRMNRIGRSNIPFGSVPEQQLTPYQQKQSEPQVKFGMQSRKRL